MKKLIKKSIVLFNYIIAVFVAVTLKNNIIDVLVAFYGIYTIAKLIEK